MIETAVNFLVETQNPDGGWGVEKGRRSNTEASAFALLGLGSQGERSLTTIIDRGLKWLTEQQHADGSWPLTDQFSQGSWATALAALALAFFASHREQALRGADWLLRQEGKPLGRLQSVIYRIAPHKLPVQQNPDLKGWSWAPNTASWVEPTAYALMALKKLRPHLQSSRIEARIHEGELLIYDRMCKGGGWNYGNSTVLGEDLLPYPDITALTLIALQDHKAEANRVSLDALQKMLVQVQSGLALSWSILCFALYSQETAEWKALLAKGYERTGFLGETKTLALALLACTNKVSVFQV